MFITVGITLYSTRIVLKALGIEDFGIFNLIGGVISMIFFFNSTMSVSTQRYLSYYQGKNDMESQKKVFTNSFFLHIVIGLLCFIVLEIAGIFLFSGILNINEDKIFAAKVVYQLMALTILFSSISAIFIAALNAHENMLWTSIVHIIEVVLKLGAAFAIFLVSENRLIWYAVLIVGVSLTCFALFAAFCLKRYEECSLRIRKKDLEKPLIKDLGSFAGWNLFGILGNFGRTQGVAVILNLFFGATINAAYAIANQVSVQVYQFTHNMLKAMNPQIMKSEGADDRKRMLRLSMIASKFGYYLLVFIAVPFIFEMPALLKIWLKDVPENTAIFCSLSLVILLVGQLTIGLQSAAQALGKIKIFQIVTGALLLINLPISYALLKLGYPAYSVLITYLIAEIIIGIFRLIYIKVNADLSIKEYIQRVFIKEIIPTCIIILTCFLITQYCEINYRFILTFSISITIFVVSVYFTGLSADEKQIVKNFLTKTIGRIKSR